MKVKLSLKFGHVTRVSVVVIVNVSIAAIEMYAVTTSMFFLKTRRAVKGKQSYRKGNGQ